MITLEKILTELKAESLNEIVAGHGKDNGNHYGWYKEGSTATTGTVSTVSEPSVSTVSETTATTSV